MREHLCSEINIFVPGRLDGRHRPMHPLHARLKLRPAAIAGRNLTLERVDAVLKGLCSDRTARQQQNRYSQCDPLDVHPICALTLYVASLARCVSSVISIGGVVSIAAARR